jgi:hypothetical protein
MKVHAQHSQDTHGAAVRLAAKARSSAPTAGDATAPFPASAPAPAPAAAAASASAAPGAMAATSSVESTVEMAARKSPPGLARVAARLEAMGADGRTGGQSNALTQITRNLQRYMDYQGVAPEPAPAPTPTPTPEQAPASPVIESAAVADTTAATDGAEPPAST